MRDADGWVETLKAWQGDSGAHAPFSHDPVPGTISAIASPDGRRVSAVYVAYENYPPNDYFPPDGTRGKLHKGPLPSLAVVATENEFAHQLVVFDAGGNAQFVDRASEASLLYELPTATIESLQQGKISAREALDVAEAHFDNHRAWVNGELCGVVYEAFALLEEGLRPVRYRAEWACVSPARALRIKERMFEEMQERQALAPTI